MGINKEYGDWLEDQRLRVIEEKLDNVSQPGLTKLNRRVFAVESKIKGLERIANDLDKRLKDFKESVTEGRVYTKQELIEVLLKNLK